MIEYRDLLWTKLVFHALGLIICSSSISLVAVSKDTPQSAPNFTNKPNAASSAQEVSAPRHLPATSKGAMGTVKDAVVTENCSIDISALNPIFAGTAPAFAGPPKVVRTKESLVETVVLKSGIKLEVTQSGCEHVFLGLKAFGLPDKTEAQDLAHYLKLGSGLFRLKLGNKDQALVPWLAENLSKAAEEFVNQAKKTPKVRPASLENCHSKMCRTVIGCGDGSCEILIEKPIELKTNLEISYTFAL